MKFLDITGLKKFMALLLAKVVAAINEVAVKVTKIEDDYLSKSGGTVEGTLRTDDVQVGKWQNGQPVEDIDPATNKNRAAGSLRVNGTTELVGDIITHGQRVEFGDMTVGNELTVGGSANLPETFIRGNLNMGGNNIENVQSISVIGTIRGNTYKAPKIDATGVSGTRIGKENEPYKDIYGIDIHADTINGVKFPQPTAANKYLRSDGTWADGVQGPKGDKGNTGPAGPTGATGAQGPQGPTGAAGAKGDKGADGATPTIGSNGNWYINGVDTTKPSRGAQGPQGNTGATGPQGPKGADGATPTIGDNGNWYINGKDTSKPSRGATGATGAQGLQGPQGPKGDQGAQGATGAKGDKGDSASGSYGTCSTAATTAAKTVSITGYKLVTGNIVTVKFTYAVPASATLNITSTGAKNIYHKGAAIAANVINAGDTATFIYNGQYHLIAIDYKVDTALNSSSLCPLQNKVIYTELGKKAGTALATTSANGLMSASDKKKLDGMLPVYYGECTNTNTNSLIVSCTGYTLSNSLVLIYIHHNCGGFSGLRTLNINGTGAKTLYSSYASENLNENVYSGTILAVVYSTTIGAYLTVNAYRY